MGTSNAIPLAVSANQILLNAPAFPDGTQTIQLNDPATGAASAMTSAVTFGAGPNDTILLVGGFSRAAPVGGQAANPIVVRVVAADGVTTPVVRGPAYS